MRQSDKAWIAFWSGVLAYDVLCDDGEMLSDATIRYKAARPVLTIAAVFTTAAHLLGWIKPERDPFHLISTLFR